MGVYWCVWEGAGSKDDCERACSGSRGPKNCVMARRSRKGKRFTRLRVSFGGSRGAAGNQRTNGCGNQEFCYVAEQSMASCHSHLQKFGIPSRDTFQSCSFHAASTHFPVNLSMFELPKASVPRVSRLSSIVSFRHSIKKTNHCSRIC